MRRINRFWFKRTNQLKHNSYVFVLCCDKNGMVLRNSIPDVPEFWETVNDATFYYSDVIMTKHSIDMGIGNVISKFKKVIDADKLFKSFPKNNFERGRDTKINQYLFQNLEDTLYREELFFNGMVWMFGNVEFLHDVKSVIDEIRVCHCNVDFTELYPDQELDVFNLNSWLEKYQFAVSDTIITETVRKNRELAAKLISKQKKSINKSEQKSEVWDNGMRVIKQEEKPKNVKLPDIYDYTFKFYKRFSTKYEKVSS